MARVFRRFAAADMLTYSGAAEVMRRAGLMGEIGLTLIKRENDVYRIDCGTDSFFLKTYTKSWYGADAAATAFNESDCSTRHSSRPSGMKRISRSGCARLGGRWPPAATSASERIVTSAAARLEPCQMRTRRRCFGTAVSFMTDGIPKSCGTTREGALRGLARCRSRAGR